MTPKLILILSENWTVMDGRDVRAQVRMAVEAEEAGFDGRWWASTSCWGRG